MPTGENNANDVGSSVSEDRSASLATRIARAEVNVDALGRDVRMLAGSVESLRSTVAGTFEKLNDRSRTNWGVMAGLGSLVLTIVALAGAPYVRELARMDTELTKLNNYDREAMYRRGRVDKDLESRAEDVKEIKSEILALDGRVQREMRDLDATTNEVVKALRERIDEKILLLEQVAQTDRARLRADIDRNRSLIDGITNQGSPAVLERMRAMERALFGDTNGTTRKGP